jgi:hypothetical protein
MIEDSLRYLRSSEQWVKTVLIGGVLMLFAFLVVPLFLAIGYFVRVLRGTMHDDDEPPVFDDWGSMLGEGLKGFAIYFVYGFVPFLIVVATTAVSSTGSEGLSAVGVAILVIGYGLGAILTLVGMYVVPAALANFVETDDLMAGFAFGELRSIVTVRQYAKGWLIAFGLILGTGIAAFALNIVPLVGTVIGAFLWFYAYVAAFYVIGHTWADLDRVQLHEEDEMPDERPAV